MRHALRVAPQFKATDAQLLLRETYETVYGIYNHDSPVEDRPLAVVGFHPAEDATGGSLLYERIEQFGKKQVTKWYGLSLTEFLELPTDVCMKIFEECEKLRNSETAQTEQALAQLGVQK